MTTLNSRLQLALINRKKGRNLIEKGFTLVELMIVIVIVGILSAVALPNFINQTLKAKGSEARSDNAAITKNAAAEYTEGGAKLISELVAASSSITPAANTYAFSAAADSCAGLGARTNTSTEKFDYYCALEIADATNTAAYGMSSGTFTAGDYLLVVTAIGDSTDSGLTGRVVTHLLNLDNGHTQLVKPGTCKAFGGTLTSTSAAGKAPGTVGTINCT